MEDNDVFANGGPGIGIDVDGEPVVRNNRIQDGKTHGICVYAGGRGTLESNEIYGNAAAGIQVGAGANPTVRDNRLHKNWRQPWRYLPGAVRPTELDS